MLASYANNLVRVFKKTRVKKNVRFFARQRNEKCQHFRRVFFYVYFMIHFIVRNVAVASMMRRDWWIRELHSSRVLAGRWIQHDDAARGGFRRSLKYRRWLLTRPCSGGGEKNQSYSSSVIAAHVPLCFFFLSPSHPFEPNRECCSERRGCCGFLRSKMCVFLPLWARIKSFQR